MRFKELNINTKLQDRILELGFSELTPIQEKCIPEIIKGKDVVGQAETGSGKTIAFSLPILNTIMPGKGIQVLVLTPTRELCVQVTNVFSDFRKKLPIKATSIYGGVSIHPQIKNLKNTDIVVGTPGRILDHLRRKTIDFSIVRFLVLDETDKMFEMGFINDVEKIIQQIPNKRQTLMFSATISSDIHNLMKRHLNNPRLIKTESYIDPSKLKQVYYDIFEQSNKFSILIHLLRENKEGLSIVFCGTRKESDIVARNLRCQGISVSEIHGGMKQQKRLNNLNSLKNQNTKVLVATDVAARGLDIKNVTHIYNYDVPPTSKEYIHRIGRTARAGEKGAAITLLTKRDHENFRRVQSNDKLKIEKTEIPSFRKVAFRRHLEQGRKNFRRKNSHSFKERAKKIRYQNSCY